MIQDVKEERATSGYPDWYRQFYVHDCDLDCFFSATTTLCVFIVISFVAMRYFFDTFNYKTTLIVHLIDGDIRRGFHDLGYTILNYKYFAPFFIWLQSEITTYTNLIAREIPKCTPMMNFIKSYNNKETWVLVLGLAAIYLAYEFCMDILRRFIFYMRERNMLYFCVNMCAPGSVDSHDYTKQMVAELLKSPEYLRLKHQRINQGPEAWNWQIRQRLGERMPSDDMSDDDL
ncbi:putative integral membrane protein [Babesia bovis T2Bo]|uniref:Uncharacterized protein n=1 Tax=Babesia bovis TaxID=5865 RepID=A7AUM4_BABBO|nr:putative integral membrane protein [Babesia bovis T2Bo]EDO06635.1 putative integral membrane protein [Babesia bovis T2Bo]BAN64445.1 hypothetical protein [Babesia bovis]|eukprot:XP_001610203.1 hypothetical protein [Babesia bovis T2Bo]